MWEICLSTFCGRRLEEIIICYRLTSERQCNCIGLTAIETFLPEIKVPRYEKTDVPGDAYRHFFYVLQLSNLFSGLLR